MERNTAVMDGNEAAASVAFRTNEVIAIYPITPASPMGESADLWTNRGNKNIWGTTPLVVEMQSEGGAAGTVHGALQAGSLTTTFTASQGLLLMIPNMYRIAGELTPTVFHIAARSLAAQALSIFGDHSDVMAARATGWGMLFANSPQEAADFALISQAASLRSRIPFLHIFDGFRTSHEVRDIEPIQDHEIRALIDDDLVRDHRSRALTPDRPVMRGTAQNPDVFFQARESSNRYYDAVPGIVEEYMNRLEAAVGRRYGLFDYVGAPDAERIIILMGSGCDAAEETVTHLAGLGEKVGMIKVRLFRPFSISHFLNAIPKTVRAISVLDRTKEPGATGEPLYQDVLAALHEQEDRFEVAPRVVGGRYGLSSKEFTPAMIKAVLDELKNDRPKNHFTIGILDDVTQTSLTYDRSFSIEPDDVTRAVFWGLGSDGTVGANKNSIKILGEHGTRDGQPIHAQGYFVYDSKKSGARTISHLRFGSRPIQSTYLIERANFVAVHQFGFLDRYDTLAMAEDGATFLLNSPYSADEVWDHLPRLVQEQIIGKKLKMYVIDALAVAKQFELGLRINTVMQTCFFALANVIPIDESIRFIKDAIRATYGKRGEIVVKRNSAAVDASLENMQEVIIPSAVSSVIELPAVVSSKAPAFVREVTATMMAGLGDDLPVSALPDDGTYPTGTTRWEKRNIAIDIPVWEPDLCIQCGKCVMVCPHAVIRAKIVSDNDLVSAPEGFKHMPASWKEFQGDQYTLQIAPEDCTGCQLCVEVCPAKDKSAVGRKALNMADQLPILERERGNWEFFETLPELPLVSGDGAPADLKFTKVKDVQLLQPLFEFSGACAGCGETPYLSLLTRLFGDRTLVANATGCSSIYGGNLPTTPWAKNLQGRGPAWSNSLFEDNAEFGLGMRLAVDKQAEYARELAATLSDVIGKDLAEKLTTAPQDTNQAIDDQRTRVESLKEILASRDDPASRDLMSLADALVKKSVWIVGGDGWAYDIGYGGLDHVLASGKNVNVLVLDTEVYSNTGGQASKSTSLGAVAKFAAGGKATPKKDLPMLAMSYGYVYVAEVALGANENQTIKAFREAESFDGPSIIIAYSQCIAHGIDMTKGMHQQTLAVESGHWPLFRFDPRNEKPLQLDSKDPQVKLEDYLYKENRYRILTLANPEAAQKYLDLAKEAVTKRFAELNRLAEGERKDEKPGLPKLPPGGSGPPRPRPVGVTPARLPKKDS
ncbi:pyruvate:ferredoxin (flavodoxin) oxidoreductase [Bacteroidota bacterium]